MVLAVSGLLEKREKIPPGSVTLEEEKVLLFSGALPGFWYSWSFSSLVGWTGGHRQSHLWSLPMCQFADTTICEYKCNRCTNGIGMGKRISKFTLKACAKVEAPTDGYAFVRLVVTFLRCTPRCIIAASDGELSPIKEIGPDGRCSIDLPLLLTDGGVLSTCNITQKVSYRWK